MYAVQGAVDGLKGLFSDLISLEKTGSRHDSAPNAAPEIA
jgi:hypothetical protein